MIPTMVGPKSTNAIKIWPINKAIMPNEKNTIPINSNIPPMIINKPPDALLLLTMIFDSFKINSSCVIIDFTFYLSVIMYEILYD